MASSDFSVAALAQALDRVSDDVKRAVRERAQLAAVRTRDRVQSAFPVGRTGTLRRRVTVGAPRGYSVSAGGTPIPAYVVRASAPHVHIWEEGTVERFDATRANARRGRSPRHGRVFEAIAVRERNEMLQDAQQLLDRPREL